MKGLQAQTQQKVTGAFLLQLSTSFNLGTPPAPPYNNSSNTLIETILIKPKDATDA